MPASAGDKAVIADERYRAAAIMAIAGRHNMRSEGDKAVADGTSLAEFRRIMLDKIGDTKPLDSAPADGYGDGRRGMSDNPASLGLSPADVSRYSLFRLIEAQATKDFSQAGFEMEANRAIADRMSKSPKGAFIPDDIWGQRDLTVGTASAGGNLKGTDHLGGQFVDALRNKLVVHELGAQVIPGLVGDIDIPAMNAQTQTYHVAENGAPTEGAPTVRQITMAPKTIAAYVDLSRRLMKQSSPWAEQVFKNDMLRNIAVGVDATAINGGGSNEPTGILQTAGIGAVALGTNGAAPTWTSISDLAKEVGIDNALGGSLAYLANAQVSHTLRTTAKVTSTDSVMIQEARDMLMGYRYSETNSVPGNLTKGSGSDLSALIFGNFSDLIIGEWGAVDVLVDPYSLSTTGATRVTIFHDYDVAVRRAESFAAILDMITT